jgi:transcriptional regulator with XRE-family HTH domain
MSIHEAIKARRLALEWSQERLAAAVSELEGLTKPLAWQTVQQWENGVSAPARKRLPHVAAALGLTLQELNARSSNQELPTGKAHVLSESDVRLSSPVIAWERVSMKTLPKAFKVAAPDDSMSPRLRKGQLAEFETGLEYRPGDGVLVKDPRGVCYIRRCRQTRGGWEAYAEDSEVFPPLPIGDDGLDVLAVMVGVHARWG